jgi:hypothetical protein
MFVRATILGLATFLAATTAQAASDVRVAIANPGPSYVYDDIHYAVTVGNTGDSRAMGVVLTVQLPKYEADEGMRILGDLGTIDSRCRLRGTQLQCRLGKMNANAVTTIGFDIALPQTDDALGVTATVSATSAETVLTNNVANRSAVLLDHAVDLGEGGLGTVEHCIDTDLGSFFECTDSDDALAEYDLGFLDTGKVSLPDRPDYTGLWTQVPAGKEESDPHYLRFEIADEEGTKVVFEGYGASDACFEGIAIYRGLDAVAGYRVCL